MNGFTPLHVERTHDFVVDLPRPRAFTLVTPEGERACAEGWDPRYLHPADGRATRGMVFTTGHGGEETLWTMVCHEPDAGVVEYARVTPGSRMGTVRVACRPLEGERTKVTVTYDLTALSESGNEQLRAFDEAGYAAYIRTW